MPFEVNYDGEERLNDTATEISFEEVEDATGQLTVLEDELVH